MKLLKGFTRSIGSLGLWIVVTGTAWAILRNPSSAGTIPARFGLYVTIFMGVASGLITIGVFFTKPSFKKHLKQKG